MRAWDAGVTLNSRAMGSIQGIYTFGRENNTPLFSLLSN